MADGPLGCRRRGLPRYLLSNHSSPPPSPTGSTSSRSSSGSLSPRRSPTSRSRKGKHHHHHHHHHHPPVSASLPLRHRLYFYTVRTIRRLAIIVSNSIMYGIVSSQRLEGLSRLCAVYSFTGILFTVSLLVKNARDSLDCVIFSYFAMVNDNAIPSLSFLTPSK